MSDCEVQTLVPEARLLTAAELAEVLAVNVQTIRDLANERRIPAFRVARDWRFRLTEVLAALRTPQA